MKRLFFIFSFFHFFIATAVAQVGDYRTDLAVGGSAGYVLSNVGFVPDVPQGLLPGYTAGLSVRYTCEKYFSSICSIVGEVNVIQTGWKEDIRDANDNPVYYAVDKDKVNPLSYERKITYLQIPFMARLGWGRERKGLQAFFQAGPQIGVYLSESTKSNIQLGKPLANDRASQVVAQDTLAVQNKFDYGIAAGAGVELSLPKVGHLILEGRYYYGLGNIFKNSKSDYFGKSNYGQIVIKATYLFDIVRTRNPKIK
ncbi:MAG: PorT family protein [Prevotella sp.]|nr:PorT family protein [Prevotella sp.]